jgi:peptidoglycan hydrolase-like protein with peptidoglycan-binding domain
MYIHTGELLGQPQVLGVSSDYIRWVQRSLNLRGECIQVSGLDSPGYREAVKRFQNSVGLPDNGKVDARTQNALIRSNHRSPGYLFWLQNAPIIPSLINNGRLDPTRIRQFQAGLQDPNIKVDGWIGPKTEAAIMISAGQPPGECV